MIVLLLTKMAGWLSGTVVGHINEVTLHWAGLELGWVTIREDSIIGI